MLYLIYGIEEFIIKKHISELVAKTGVAKESVMKFDLSSTSLEHVIDKVNIYDLFSDTNVVVADNFGKFLGSKKPNKEFQIEQLITFMESENENTLILVVNNEKVTETTLLKKLELRNQAIQCKKMPKGEIKKLMQKAFVNRGKEVDLHTIEYLYNKTNGNIRGTLSEIEKLSISKSKITPELIDLMVNPKTEDNIFSLVESIMSKDLENSILKYKDLIRKGTSPLSILTLVSTEIALIMNVKSSNEWSISNGDLALKLKRPSFVITKALNRSSKYTEKALKEITNLISELEFDFKTGKINQDSLIELFIIKLIKGEHND